MTRNIQTNGMINNRGLARQKGDKTIIFMTLSYLAIGVSISFFTPHDILEKNDSARSFVELMSFIPYVKKVSESPIGQIAQFFAAIMWALTPVVFIFAMKVMVVPMQRVSERSYSRSIKMAIAIFIIGPIPIITKLFLISSDRLIRAETHSSLGLGILGSLSIYGVPLILAAMIYSCKSLWRNLP